MTEQPPTSPGPAAPPPSDPSPAEDPKGRSGKRLVIAGIIAVAVLALGGAAFAVFQKLDGGGAQPHDVLPESVVAYARVDLDPSASQKIALLKLIRKFPEAADDIGIKSADQDVRELLVKEALKAGSCDLTYDEDVEPWLGSRVGVALDKKQTPLVAIQVTDEDKAAKGIEAIFTCSGEKAAVAFLDGYAVVAEDQKGADAAVKAATTSSLGDNADFAKDTESLGEQGVASAWVDTDALIDEFPEMKDLAGSSPDQLKQLEQVGSGAMALRADGSTLELAGISGLTDALDELPAAPLTKLPSDTVAALSVGGLGEQISAQYDTFLEQLTGAFGGPSVARVQAAEPSVAEGITPGKEDEVDPYAESDPAAAPTPDDFVAELERETGLKLPDDLETLFGDGLTIAIGSENLQTLPTMEGPADITSLDAALQMTTDPAKALDLAKRLAALAAQAGITLSTAQTDDGAVLATNPEAAGALDGSGRLGDDETFSSVMPYGDDTTYGLFVDVGTILDQISKADPPEDISKDIEEAKALKAVGVSAGKKGDHSVFSIRIALKK
ncbi:DUF3352 domain-containing protein [Aeromicrobium sp.]|uniref:DUF3352 domain-containing protein n=1 Tax=Aeromicrobium sp. TaxID=1871063 RepID=UPI0030BB34A1